MPSVTRSDDNGVATLTLCRPPINALDRLALDDIGAAVARLASDRRVRAVILASGVDGVFCAGGDLKYWRRFGREAAREVSRAGRDVFAALARLPQPTIAAIEGDVIGDGLALVLSTDLRIASRRATFRVPEAAYGFIPGWGLAGLLERQVGIGGAAEMLLTGSVVDAERAHRVRLVSDVVPAGEALPAAQELARSLTPKSPVAVAALKQVLWPPSGTADRAAWEEACFARTWGGPDWQEGIDALLAKRAPEFRDSPQEEQ